MPTERLFTCNLCEAACGLRVEVDGARVGSIRGDSDDVFSRGHICPKAFGLGELLHDPDRLRSPMRKTAHGFEPISWSDAFDEIGARLGEIRTRHGRDAVALYVGNPVVHSHRSSLASQLLTLAIGSKNRFDPNSQDSNPRLFACMQMYGDALSLPVPDIDRTDLMIILGANPAASNGSQMGLGDVRARMRGIRERGGRVVLIDPRRTESVPWCDVHHFIRPGGDAALLLAMLNVLFSARKIDFASVAARANGLEALRAIAQRYTPERVAPVIGIDADVIRSLALEFAATPRACIYSRVGVCQNEFGPVASWLVEVLNVVTGHFDREGCVMFPTPAADIAPLGRLLVGNNTARWRSRVRGLPEFLGAFPSAVMAEEMETPGEGQVRALVCLAGNPVLSTPNGPRLERAIAGLEYVVAIDLYLNETSRLANIVLPTKHIFETGNFDLVLHRLCVRNVLKYSEPIVRTDDDTRDDWDIACELAGRLAAPDSPRVRRAWKRVSRSLPETLIDLLLRIGPRHLSLAKLRAALHGIDFGPLEPSGNRNVRTPDRRVRLVPDAFRSDLARLDDWLGARREGLVLIGRRHMRSNNSWLHNLPTLVKGPDRTRLLMHPDDAAERGITTGSHVRIASRTGAVIAVVEVSADMMRGVVSLPHGFGHARASDTLRIAGKISAPSANALTDELFVEPVIGTSVLNGVPVRVEMEHEA